MTKRFFFIIAILTTIASLKAKAQVGDYRNAFAVGISGGYDLSTVGFMPKVTQAMKGGITAGIAARYTSEKYFSTLCAVQMEVNLAQTGWKEDIKTIDETPVINPVSGVAEEYERTLTYIQIPVMAHLSWGKEKRGFNGFIDLGPQIGFCIGEKTSKNYEKPFIGSNFGGYTTSVGRVNQVVEQETMPIENKIDYGITVGAGIEGHIKNVGRFSLEGRYYYGLGNLYGDSKRDYFGISNFNIITIKMGYLFDL